MTLIQTQPTLGFLAVATKAVLSQDRQDNRMKFIRYTCIMLRCFEQSLVDAVLHPLIDAAGHRSRFPDPLYPQLLLILMTLFCH